MPLHNYRPDLMGEAEITPGGRFEAGSWSSFTLVYTAGIFGIDDRGSLKLVMRGHADMSAFQTTDPDAPGYLTVSASNGAPLVVKVEDRRSTRPWNRSVYIQCLSYLNERDTITINIGDTAGGCPGIRLQTFCEETLEFRILVDPFAAYEYIAIADEKQPTIAIVPGKPMVWKAILPTLRKPNSKFRLSLKCEDRWGNPSDQIDSTIRIESSRPIQGLPDTVTFLPGEFTKVIDGLTVEENGEVRIRVIDADSEVVAQSNPLLIKEDATYEHYWSDMHGQSEETIGSNSARDYFLFGRDKGFLDIQGHQGNDFQITDAFWSELNDLTAEFNDPGRYITLPGYEWSGNTGLGGDHNVWYRNEGRPIYRSSRALVNDTTLPETDCHSVIDLFTALRNEDAIVTAHVGGRYADVKYAHDAKVEPSVEVHSAWGSFDWILEDAFRMNYRIGIVCSSDGHKGRPGASYPGDSKFGSYGGLTCHLLPELTRDAVFSEFRRRHHYGTTGARMFVHTSAAFKRPATLYLRNPELGASETKSASEVIMGDIVETNESQVSFNLEVVGTAALERVEIKNGLDVIETLRSYESGGLGNRIRIVCEGAKYKGRGRLVEWTAKATFQGLRISQFATANFWNPDSQPKKVGPYELLWNCVTTGGSCAVDVWLDGDWDTGRLVLETSEGNVEVDLKDVGYDDHHTDLGGLRKGIRLYRLPEKLEKRSISFSRRIALEKGSESRLYARISQEDGHIAWTSPIYIIPK